MKSVIHDLMKRPVRGFDILHGLKDEVLRRT